MLDHLLEHGDIVGPDPARQTIIQPSVDDNVLETLMALDAESADLEAVPRFVQTEFTPEPLP